MCVELNADKEPGCLYLGGNGLGYRGRNLTRRGQEPRFAVIDLESSTFTGTSGEDER